MKRNKKTEVVARVALTPLTSHILDGMGREGAAFRLRLQRFYRDRALDGAEPAESGPGAGRGRITRPLI
jgi:hypothetical protein